ncbi:MAG TPA: hypothetical protein VGF96_05945 [Terracidiphilus sp.]|jgi:hypothetical protein
MQRTLSEHITFLEQRIESLKNQLQETDKWSSQQSEIKIDLSIAERALVHFRRAFEFEQKLKQRPSQ